jgi:hypothetical protein
MLAATSAFAAPAAIAGPAVNQFEIKDLEVNFGDLQFQSQNAYSVGSPRRRIFQNDEGELKFDDNSATRDRYAQELEAHLTSFFRMRVGLEFEKERLDDPGTFDRADSYDALKLSEYAIEGVLVLVPVPKAGGIGVGLIAEYQHPNSSREASTLFMGTILQAVQGPWSATADLFLVRWFSPLEEHENGASRDNKWDFAYAARVMYTYSETWAFALEGYGTVDRLGNSGSPGEERLLFGDHDQHRIGPVVYYSWKLGGEKVKHRLGLVPKSPQQGDDDGPRANAGKTARAAGDDDDNEPTATLGFGVLAGVTPSTPAATFKLSLEVDF